MHLSKYFISSSLWQCSTHELGDCVIRPGTSFDRANYTGRLVEGTPTEVQLFQVSEVSTAPLFLSYESRQRMFLSCFLHIMCT